MSFFPYAAELAAATGTTPSTKTPVTATQLTSGGSGTDGTGFTTASISPTAGKLVLMAIFNENAASGTSSAPTSVSGAGLTFTKLIEGVTETSWGNFSIWYACGASPSSGAITITHGVSKNYCEWSITEFACAASTSDNGLSAIVQVSPTHFTGASQADTVLVLSGGLSAFQNVGNATYFAIGQLVGSVPTVASAPGSGMTELSDHATDTSTSGYCHVAVEWKNSAEQVPSLTNSPSPGGTNCIGCFAIELKAVAASGSVTLTANNAAISVATTSTNLEFGHKLTANNAAVTIATTSTGLNVGRKITANNAAISIAATSTNIKVAHRLTTNAGAVNIATTSVAIRKGITLTANAAAIALSSSSAALIVSGRKISASAGSVAVTGASTSLKLAHKLTANAAAVSIAGTNAQLSYGRKVTANFAAITVAASSVLLLRSRKLSTSTSPIAISTTAANLKVAHKLTASAGAVTISGSSTSLIKSQAGSLIATSASIVIAFTPMNLRATRILTATGASVSVTGQSANLNRGRKVTANGQSIIVSTSALTLKRGRTIKTNVATINVVAATLSMLSSHKLSASPAAILIDGQAQFHVIRRLGASSAGLNVVGNSVVMTTAVAPPLFRSKSVFIVDIVEDTQQTVVNEDGGVTGQGSQTSSIVGIKTSASIVVRRNQ